MYTVKIRLPGAMVSLMLVAVMVLAFAAAAAAQTPADDQYGSPTDPAATAEGGAAEGTGGGVASDISGGEDTSKAGEASGGVLPSTGGAPVSLLLAGTILVGSAVTLRLGHRAGS